MTQKNHVTLFNDAVTLFSGFINSYINFPPAFSRYTQDFILPTLISFNAFVRAETKKSPASSIEDNMEAYLNFAHLNADLLFRELNGCQDAWFHFLNNNSLFKQISETVENRRWSMKYFLPWILWWTSSYTKSPSGAAPCNALPKITPRPCRISKTSLGSIPREANWKKPEKRTAISCTRFFHPFRNNREKNG